MSLNQLDEALVKFFLNGNIILPNYFQCGKLRTNFSFNGNS